MEAVHAGLFLAEMFFCKCEFFCKCDELMGWLMVVGSIKLQVSLAKEPYKRNAILQKRRIILSILLIVATPSVFTADVHCFGYGLLRMCSDGGCTYRLHLYVTRVVALLAD